MSLALSGEQYTIPQAPTACQGKRSKGGIIGAIVSHLPPHKEIAVGIQIIRSLLRGVGHYAAEGITIHDNRAICSHSGFCSDNLRAVFDPKRKPWIDAGAAGAERIAAVVRMCPSGALSYSIGGVEHRDREREPEILVSKDGPYYVRGGIGLADAPWGEGASREHYALCRCGESKNKPFCDGTHWAIEFRDEKN